jgi:hypothetical protein
MYEIAIHKWAIFYLYLYTVLLVKSDYWDSGCSAWIMMAAYPLYSGLLKWPTTEARRFLKDPVDDEEVALDNEQKTLEWTVGPKRSLG